MAKKEEKHHLDNLYVVLVEPKNPGNIGSVVRAMKNMGVSKLRLVNPVNYRDDIEQRKMGYRSQEIVAASEEFPTLDAALADITLSFLATAKIGKWKKDFLFPEKAGEKIAQRPRDEKIAVVFGREDSGVTIDESQLVNFCISIPAAVSYPSLNLSQAALVVLYSIYRETAKPKPFELPRRATNVEFTRIYDNIWLLMKGLLFREQDKGLFHRSLKRALNRTSWTNADVAVFDRLCKQTRWFINSCGKEDFKDEYDPDADYGAASPSMAEPGETENNNPGTDANE